MPLIPALRRQRQVDLSEFEASLVYKGLPGQPRLHRESVSRKTKQKSVKQSGSLKCYVSYN